jgi:hypothetical protein
VAVAAGLLVIDKGTVTAGPSLAGWASAGESDILAWWLSGLRDVCEAESDRRSPRGMAILVLVLLEVLCQDEPPTGHELRWAVRERVADDDVFLRRMRRQDVRAAFGSDHRRRSSQRALALLDLFGAVVVGSGGARITPLGRWAVPQLRAGMPHSAGPELSATEVIELLVAYGGGSAELQWKLVQPWLAARTLEVAARELLDAAALAPASLRVAVVEVVDRLDESGLPVWRELADQATIGPHARAVLATFDEEDPELAVRAGDGAWLAVEAAAAALADPGPDEALTLVYEGMPGPDVYARVGAVATSGHPEAAAVTQALTAFLGSGQPRTIDQVHQLKVTLRGWDSPIWRRVLVPSIASLATVHEVVQVLFGWDGDHLHLFDADGEYYSNPFMTLEQTRDEFVTRVASVLTRPKQKIAYRYDLGAGWRHKIRLEK